MIKYDMACVILLVTILGCSSSNVAKVDEQEKEIKYNRHPSQIYLEDSTDVFWTYYPDPFSNPTFPDRFVVTQAISFKCFLPGKVEIGFIDAKNDSVIYNFTQPNKKIQKFNEHFWIWFAKNSADTSQFPDEYFQSQSVDSLNLVLIVNNRMKTILPLNLVVPIEIYCFINWSNYFK